MSLIFGRCWIYVGHASELKKPGDFRSRKVAGRPVIFCRDGDARVVVRRESFEDLTARDVR